MAGSVSGGITHSYQVLLANFQSALINTTVDRCAQLTQLLQDSPLKELQYIFPTLVENIFGFCSGVDWGLLSLEKDIQVKEFDAIKRFLSPDGPVLRLVYKFIEEFSPKFDFPISFLPAPSQLMLQDGKVPPLYTNKLQIVNPGQFPSAVQLNAFEFYFFHFTYFIVNPSPKNSMSVVNQQDTLYAHILEDYLFYFLPTDGRAVPLYQTPSNVQHSPILTSSLSSTFGSPHVSSESLGASNHPRPGFATPVRQKPSLLKKGTLMMVASSTSNSPCGFGSSQTESWRSETFLLILKEMYLNQNVDHQQNVPGFISKSFVPSHYHVWMVRILVKHLHFFFNSSLSSSQMSGHGQIMIDSLGRLKSLGMTQLIQKEMYCFLKSTFDHWPLDASFRVPLETWLSYIQPWRYTQCDLDPAIWQKFMTENVLFYTIMFQQILRRFLRMDLNCPKNAYMLYRLTKVFSISDMREMIMQAEKGVVSKPSSIGLSPSYARRSPEKSFFFRKISQLELSGINYVPLFSEPVFMMVTHLLSAISIAIEQAQHPDTNKANDRKGFVNKVFDFFKSSESGYNSDENSPADIRKISSYLEASAKQLCLFFQEVSPTTLNMSVSSESSPGPSFRSSTKVKEPKIHDLSNLERFLMLNKKKQPKVDYYGNPDLQPVRTYEIASLVTFFNEISALINEKYGSEMQRIYNSPTLWGKVCRKILQKPTIYFHIIKSSSMESVSRNPVYLPPRISLRFFASKTFVIYSWFCIILSIILGYNPVLILIFILIIVSLCTFAIALLHPVPIENKED